MRTRDLGVFGITSNPLLETVALPRLATAQNLTIAKLDERLMACDMSCGGNDANATCN